MTWKTIFRSSLAILLLAAWVGAGAKEPENYAKGAADMAWISFQRGDLDGAMERFGRAIKLDPQWAGGYYGKAYIYSQREEFELAFDYYRKAVELDPGFARAYSDYALALMSTKRAPEALPLLLKAQQLEPENGMHHARLALYYFLAGKYAKAWEHVHGAEALHAEISENFLRSLRSRMPDPRLDI
ncbi:MAG: tetratricopeptide repeat protein [Pseudomonadota bacterium]